MLLPTLIDVAGLSDDLDNKMEELLRLLFYGHIEVVFCSSMNQRDLGSICFLRLKRRKKSL